ncbi:hypothetical protein DFJ74DRAFT_766119 [Hyaloraphidium curvatum]|nr:hypothetical protein DFJ74DRAFT_766119 [Hyaloraphidium curvatum]
MHSPAFVTVLVIFALFFPLKEASGIAIGPAEAAAVSQLLARQGSPENSQGSVTALLLPSYGNQTHLRLQGQLFSTPVSGGEEALSGFVSAIGSLLSGGLNDTEKDALKNRTHGFLVVGKVGENVTVQATLLDSVANTSGPASPPVQTNLTAGPTDINGFFDTMVPIAGELQLPQAQGSGGHVVALRLEFANSTAGSGGADAEAAGSSANRTEVRAYVHVAPAQLPSDNASVPVSVVADIDDLLRVTRIWHPLEGLKATFTQNPYEVLPGMPDVFASWNSTLDGASGPVIFHYLTTTPFPLVGAYEDFLATYYPPGSLDMRPLYVLNPGEVLEARSQGLARIFETFASLRKFILVGDTSSPTALSGYADIARQYAPSISCIYVRNTTQTDDSFDTIHGKPSNQKLQSIFQGVDSSKVVFFGNASDLAAQGVDPKGGKCGGGTGSLVALSSIAGAGARRFVWEA